MSLKAAAVAAASAAAASGSTSGDGKLFGHVLDGFRRRLYYAAYVTHFYIMSYFCGTEKKEHAMMARYSFKHHQDGVCNRIQHENFGRNRTRYIDIKAD